MRRLLALLFFAWVAFAGKTTIVEQADRVLAVAKDPSKLRALARMGQPSHWAVADELSSRGEHDVAIAFARVAKRNDREKLVAYLESRRASPTPKGTWAVLVPIWYRNFSDPKSVPALVAPYMKQGGFVGAWALTVHAVSMLKTGRGAEAESLLRQALAGMEKLGCLDGMAWDLRILAAIAFNAGRPEEADRAARRIVELHEGNPHVVWLTDGLDLQGRLLMGRGKTREAAEIFDECLRLRRTSGDKLGGTLYQAAIARHRLGETERALELAEAAIVAHKAEDFLAGVSGALRLIGTIESNRGSYRQALRRFQKALAIDERTQDRHGVILTLTRLGGAHHGLGNGRKALETLNRALRLGEAMRNPAAVGEVLPVLGDVHQRMGDLAQARACFARALRISERLRDHVRIASVLARLGGIHLMRREYDEALAYYGRALRMAREASMPSQEASCLLNIVDVHRSRGAYDEAQTCQARAQAISRRLGDRVREARALALLGDLQGDRGDHRTALETYRRVLKMQEQDNPLARVETLRRLAYVHGALGAPDEAMRMHERLLRVARAANARSIEAVVLRDIGTLNRRRGFYAKALDLYERAHAIFVELKMDASAAAILSSIRVVSGAGDPARARKLLERALARARQRGMRGEEARLLLSLGVAERDLSKKIEYYRQALALNEQLGQRNNVAIVLGNLGVIYSRSGDLAKASMCLERARKLSEELGDRLRLGFALMGAGLVADRRGKLTAAEGFFEQALNLAVETGRTRDEVLAWSNMASVRLRLGKPRAAIDAARNGIAKLTLLVGGLDEQRGASTRDQWVGIMDGGMRAAAQLGDLSEVSFFIESARSGVLLESLGGREKLRESVLPPEMRALEAKARSELRAAQARYRAATKNRKRKQIRAARVALDEAQTRMLEAVARVQRAAKSAADVVYPKAADLKDIQASLGKDEALVSYAPPVAFVVTRDGARIVKLKPPDSKVAWNDPEQDTDAQRVRLREALIEPLKLKARRILVSPAGELAYVPFVLLMPDKEVVYVPSGTTHGVLLTEAKKRGDGILALGDPDYSGTKLEQLPATRKEAKSIGTKVLLGEEATPAGLRAALSGGKRWRAVHLACHGLVHRERPLLSSLALTGGSVSVLDVYRTKIPADLVVLSACETARGQVFKAEGVVGFVRAFMLAGAPRVIVSLWKVDDEATSALMTEFYKQWKGGAGAAAALKQAQVFVAGHDKWKHPYFWAAWQLWGLAE